MLRSHTNQHCTSIRVTLRDSEPERVGRGSEVNLSLRSLRSGFLVRMEPLEAAGREGDRATRLIVPQRAREFVSKCADIVWPTASRRFFLSMHISMRG